MRWHNNFNFFWGGKKSDPNRKLGWKLSQEDLSRSCSNDFFEALPTYDDFIAGGISREKRKEMILENLQQQEKKEGNDDDDSFPCDPFTVPFYSSSSNRQQEKESKCLNYMKKPKNWESV